MPLLPPLAVLTAQGVLNLSARGSRGFFLLLALLLIALGLLFAAANIYPLFLGELPAPLSALQPTPLALTAALVQACGIILWKGLNRSFAGGALLVLTFLVLVYTAPMAYYATAAASVDMTAPVEPSPAQEAPAMEDTPSETPVQPSEPTAPATDGQAAPAPSTPVEAPAAAEPQATSLPAPEEPAAATEAAPAAQPAPAN